MNFEASGEWRTARRSNVAAEPTHVRQSWGQPRKRRRKSYAAFSSGSAPAAKHTFKTSNPLQLLNIGIDRSASAALFGQHTLLGEKQARKQ